MQNLQNQTPHSVLATVDSMIASAIAEVEQSPVWRTVVSESTSMELLRAIMRQIYLELFSYQPSVVEAAFTAIGRFPKTEPRLVRTLAMLESDEVDHGEIALRDYVALGGRETVARQHRMTPASFAFVGMWRELARAQSPYAYAGAMYSFEAMTPIFCEKVRDVLRARGFLDDALGFIVSHAKEDIAHSNALRMVLEEIAQRFPEGGLEIEYGVRCFLHLFPLPIWMAAYKTALAECEGSV